MLPQHTKIIDIHHACIVENGREVMIEFITSDGGAAGVTLSLDELEFRCASFDDGGTSLLMAEVTAVISRAARND